MRFSMCADSANRGKGDPETLWGNSWAKEALRCRGGGSVLTGVPLSGKLISLPLSISALPLVSRRGWRPAVSSMSFDVCSRHADAFV